MRAGLLVLVGCYTGQPAQPQPYRLAYSDEQRPTPGPDPLEAKDAKPTPIAIANGDALVLLGRERAALGRAGPHTYARICVQDQARIDVDGSTELVLDTEQATVIGGRGIGPSGSSSATIKITAKGKQEIFVLFDNERAPIDAVFDAPHATVHVGLTGKTGLKLDGKIGTSVMNAGWGLPPSFPTCDRTMDRDQPATFPASVDRPANCVGKYRSSNYVTPQSGKRELHVVGVYEGKQHVNGTIVVRVAQRSKPIVLALGAYQPAIWKLELAPGARIAAIYTFGYNAQQLVDVPQGTSVVALPDKHYAYGWEPATNSGGGGYPQMIAAVRKATGMTESSFQGCYAGNTFDIP